MCRGRGLGGFLAVALVEAIDASSGIDELLFTREERVASRTDFDVQVTFFGGASFESFAARTTDGYFNVFGVNSWFHTRAIIGSYIRIVKFGEDLDAKAQRRNETTGLTLRLCVFASKVLRIPLPEDTVGIALDCSIG